MTANIFWMMLSLFVANATANDYFTKEAAAMAELRESVGIFEIVTKTKATKDAILQAIDIRDVYDRTFRFDSP